MVGWDVLGRLVVAGTDDEVAALRSRWLRRRESKDVKFERRPV